MLLGECDRCCSWSVSTASTRVAINANCMLQEKLESSEVRARVRLSLRSFSKLGRWRVNATALWTGEVTKSVLSSAYECTDWASGSGDFTVRSVQNSFVPYCGVVTSHLPRRLLSNSLLLARSLTFCPSSLACSFCVSSSLSLNAYRPLQSDPLFTNDSGTTRSLNQALFKHKRSSEYMRQT